MNGHHWHISSPMANGNSLVHIRRFWILVLIPFEKISNGYDCIQTYDNSNKLSLYKSFSSWKLLFWWTLIVLFNRKVFFFFSLGSASFIIKCKRKFSRIGQTEIVKATWPAKQDYKGDVGKNSQKNQINQQINNYTSIHLVDACKQIYLCPLT